MLVPGRLVVAMSLLAVWGAGCALLDGGSEVSDCEAVRVTFEDALGAVRGADGAAPDGGAGGLDQDALRDVVELHDARAECFGREHGEFLEPARDRLDGEQAEFLEPVREQLGASDAPRRGVLDDRLDD